jgi:hypothetical protein
VYKYSEFLFRREFHFLAHENLRQNFTTWLRTSFSRNGGSVDLGQSGSNFYCSRALNENPCFQMLRNKIGGRNSCKVKKTSMIKKSTVLFMLRKGPLCTHIRMYIIHLIRFG